MKIIGVVLLLLNCVSPAKAEKGVVIKIFPDKLIFPSDCETWADPQAKEFSILLTCNNSVNQKYFFNFRLNNIDFTSAPNVIEVNKTRFKSYTVYEITDKGQNGENRKSFHFCTREVCLDLVAEFEIAVKQSIMSQLQR